MLEALYPWPIEEAVFRPIVSLLLAALLPLALHRAVVFSLAFARESTAEREHRGGLAAIGGVGALATYAMGVTAIGPAWTDTSLGVAAHASGLACALSTMLATVVLWRRAKLGPLAALAERAAWGPLVPTGLVLLLLVIGWLAGDVTRIADDEAELVQADETWRRLRIDPWDANATLALAWQARRREDLERAAAYADEAQRMGVSSPALLELRAELLAARGECEAARETFDEALAARVVDPLAVSLELGGYRIPPTLLTECGMGEVPRR